jgi:hypothetical protein
MTRASYPIDRFFSFFSVLREQTPKRRSILTIIIDALHHSRRRQARRVLWQHRHLIASHPDYFKD